MDGVADTHTRDMDTKHTYVRRERTIYCSIPNSTSIHRRRYLTNDMDTLFSLVRWAGFVEVGVGIGDLSFDKFRYWAADYYWRVA